MRYLIIFFLIFILKDWLGAKLGFKERQDWYRVSLDDFLRHDGSGLLKVYDGNRFQILSNAYKDFDFKPWLFVRKQRSFWVPFLSTFLALSSLPSPFILLYMSLFS